MRWREFVVDWRGRRRGRSWQARQQLEKSRQIGFLSGRTAGKATYSVEAFATRYTAAFICLTKAEGRRRRHIWQKENS